MLPYLILLMLTATVYTFFYYADYKFKNIGMFYIAIIFIFFSGLRGNVGTDYLAYSYHFSSVCNAGGDIDRYSDFGFYYFLSLFCDFNFEFFVFSLSLISLAIFFITLVKLSVAPIWAYFTSFLLYIPFFGYNGFRQGIALSFFQLSILLLLDRKVRSYIYLFVGGLFHKSALMLLPISFLTFTSINRHKLVVFILSVLIFISYFVDPFYIVNTLKIDLGLYSKYELSDYNVSSSGSGFFVILWNLLILSILIFKYKKMIPRDKVLSILSSLSVISINMGFYSQIFLRLDVYFSWSKPILICNLIMLVENSKIKYGLLLSFISYALYTYYQGYLINIHGLIPYTFFH